MNSDPPESPSDRTRISSRITLVPRGKKGIYHADFHHFGKHCRVSMKTSNLRCAKQNAQDLERTLLTGTFQPTPKAIDFPSAIHVFLENRKTKQLKSTTITKYQRDLKIFTDYANTQGVRLIQQLDYRLFDDFLNHLRCQDFSPKYIYCISMTIMAWTKWLRRQKHTASNPLEGYSVPKPKPRRHAAATKEQVFAMLARLSRIELVVTATAAFTGMRVGEIVALRPQDVDLKSAVIHVRSAEDWDPKTAAGERLIPIHPRLLAMLQAYRKAVPINTGQTTFFTAPMSTRYPMGDHPLDRVWINTLVKRTASSLGYEVGRKTLGITAHSLRRSFKSIAIDAGVPESLVDRWVGHIGPREINAHYYRPQLSAEWMSRMPLGRSSKGEINRITGDRK